MILNLGTPYAVGRPKRKKKEKKKAYGSPCCGSTVTSPTRIHEDVCSLSGITQWVKDPALL